MDMEKNNYENIKESYLCFSVILEKNYYENIKKTYLCFSVIFAIS